MPNCLKCFISSGSPRKTFNAFSGATVRAHRLVMDSGPALNYRCLTFGSKLVSLLLCRGGWCCHYRNWWWWWWWRRQRTRWRWFCVVLVCVPQGGWVQELHVNVGHHKCALVLALTSMFLLCMPERSTGLHRNRYCEVLDRKGLPLA